MQKQRLKQRIIGYLKSGEIWFVTNDSGLMDRLATLAELMYVQDRLQSTHGRLLTIHFAWEPNKLCEVGANQLQLGPLAKRRIYLTDADPKAMNVAGSGQMASDLGFPISYLWSLELLRRYSREFRAVLGIAESTTEPKCIGIHLRATDFWNRPVTMKLQQLGVNDSNFACQGADILMNDRRFRMLSEQLPVVVFGDDLEHVSNLVSLLRENGLDADAANPAESVTASSFGFRTTSPNLTLKDLRRLAKCPVIVKSFGRFALGAAAVGFTDAIFKIDFAQRKVLDVTHSLFQGKDNSCLDKVP